LRTTQDGSRTEIPVNITKIQKGKAEDTTLAANDILFVPESKGKFVSQQATQAGMSALTGWLIWTH
jgi:hypothetical protein